MTTVQVITDLAYLFAASLFIFGLKRLSHPRTARSGNLLGATGMLIAVVVTVLSLFARQGIDFTWVIVGLVVGGAIGVLLAKRVEMTAMPQLVAVFNGLGGGASALVAAAEYFRAGAAVTLDTSITIMISVLIGSVTLSGSFIAFGKLQGVVSEKAITFPLQKVLNGLLALGIVGLAAYLVATDVHPLLFGALGLTALVFGVLLVVPIGGGDMPVVVALLNSYSGMAAAAAGFVLYNNALIVSGALVGASGLILTNIMCKAMNRSLANVMFGAFGADTPQLAAVAGGPTKVAKSLSAEDAAVLLGYAESVVFVPGYGMALAQAQHALREVADRLKERGIRVVYAVHPVAGRMPGHMNVLLAEANVPYDEIEEMDRVNSEMDRMDVAVIIGANDVVNPAARHDQASPIYGMPIIDVDRAKNVIVMKRSLNPGFAGIDNELFYLPNAQMLFGDAKKSLNELVEEVKGL